MRYQPLTNLAKHLLFDEALCGPSSTARDTLKYRKRLPPGEAPSYQAPGSTITCSKVRSLTRNPPTSPLSLVPRRTRIIAVRLFLTNLAIHPHNRHLRMLIAANFICASNRFSLSIENLRRARRALSPNLPSPIFAMSYVLVGHAGSPFCCPIPGRVLELTTVLWKRPGMKWALLQQSPFLFKRNFRQIAYLKYRNIRMFATVI